MRLRRFAAATQPSLLLRRFFTNLQRIIQTLDHISTLDGQLLRSRLLTVCYHSVLPWSLKQSPSRVRVHGVLAAGVAVVLLRGVHGQRRFTPACRTSFLLTRVLGMR
ncbi:hypothetical protein INR49_004791 [Caranx melampygus]|nr:hypothetical protein INR49_004791 [Caranx melampygus]